VISQICVSNTTYFLLALPDPRRRSSERTIDWRVASPLIRTLSTEQWISGVIDCVNISARKER